MSDIAVSQETANGTAVAEHPPDKPTVRDAFISYSRKDFVFVQRLTQELEKKGKSVWMDKEDIAAAQAWNTAAFAGIDAAHNFLFVISPDSVAKRSDGTPTPCEQEIARAVSSGKRLIPIHLRTTPHADVVKEVRVLNDIDFRDTDEAEQAFSHAFETLVLAMDTDLAWMAEKTILQLRAQEWTTRGREKSRLLRGDELKRFEAWMAQGAGQPFPATQLQTEYLLISRQEANRIQRLISRVIGVVAIVLLIITAIAIWQGIVATRQARIATAGQFAASALLLQNDHFDLAMLLGAESRALADTYESRNAVVSLCQSQPHLTAVLHASRVMASGDGKTLLLYQEGGQSTHARLWDAVSRKSTWSGDLPGDPVAITFDGSLLATKSDGAVKLWDTRSHSTRGDSFQTELSDFAFSPEGSMLLAKSVAVEFQVWAVNGHQPQQDNATIDAGQDVADVAFLPGEHATLGLLHKNGRLSFVDAQTLRILPRTPLALAGRFNDNYGWDSKHVSFSSDGRLAAVDNGFDKVVVATIADPTRKCSFDFRAGVLVQRDTSIEGGKQYSIETTQFSPDGRYLTVVTSLGWANVWDVQNCKEESESYFDPWWGRIESAAYLYDGGLALASRGDVPILDPHHARAEQMVSILPPGSPGSAGSINGLSFTRDGKQVLAVIHGFGPGSAPDSVAGWDLSASAPLAARIGFRSPENGQAGVDSFAFSADGSEFAALAVSSDHDAHLSLWDTASGNPLPGSENVFPRDDKDLLWVLAAGPAGQFAGVTNDGKVQVFESDRGLIRASSAPSQPLHAALSDDGKILAVAGLGAESIVLFSVRRGKVDAMPYTIDAGHFMLFGLQFSPNSKLLAVFSGDGLSFWDTRTGKSAGGILDWNHRSIDAVSFSPDGRTIAARLVKSSRYGSMATATDANAVAVADMQTRQQLGTVMRPYGGEAYPGQTQLSSPALAFSPDASLLASGYENAALRIWQNPLTGSWRDRACSVAQRNLSMDEWRHYFGNAAYRRTCPDLPDGAGVLKK